MRKTVLLLLLFVSNWCVAQHGLKPCGSITHRSDWLKNYQKNPDKFQKRSGETLWVPLAVHLVGTDLDTRYFPESNLADALCTLNDDFADSEIQFYLGQPVNYIANSRWFEHETVIEGAEMMFANNVDNMINCYFMDRAAGNCGYNLPYAGVAVARSCAGPDDHTWAHEIGHNLSLPHPFLGWEGGVSYDGSVDHDFDDPAPERVTYNYTFFKDTLILDTLIIDTAWVEKMDGSNCAFAADGFCDTKPDYLAGRWNCNSDNNSTTNQTDPNGETFISDGSLIMSYALDECSSRFSPEQMAAMKANLIDEKPGYLGGENLPAGPLGGPTTLVSPEDEQEDIYFKDVELTWEPVENATKYLINFSTRANFSNSFATYVSNTNSLFFEELPFERRTYYWRVKAINEYEFCAEYSEPRGFTSTNIETSVEELEAAAWEVIPTNVVGETIQIETSGQLKNAKYSIYSIAGQQLQNGLLTSKSNIIDVASFAKGAYLVVIENNGLRFSKKFVKL